MQAIIWNNDVDLQFEGRQDCAKSMRKSISHSQIDCDIMSLWHRSWHQNFKYSCIFHLNIQNKWMQYQYNNCFERRVTSWYVILPWTANTRNWSYVWCLIIYPWIPNAICWYKSFLNHPVYNFAPIILLLNIFMCFVCSFPITQGVRFAISYNYGTFCFR